MMLRDSGLKGDDGRGPSRTFPSDRLADPSVPGISRPLEMRHKLLISPLPPPHFPRTLEFLASDWQCPVLVSLYYECDPDA